MSAVKSIGHRPAGPKWEFDESVTECFEDMLERSIPQYSAMRLATTEIAANHAQPGTAIIDLGCSRGGAIARLIERLETGGYEYIGVDISEPMLSAARKELPSYVRVEAVDLRERLPNSIPASVVLSCLTLQFVPIEYRHQIVARVKDRLVPGGAFILVEKVLSNTGALNAEMAAIYSDLKIRNGYSQEDVRRKAMSLEGALVPITADWNVDLLTKAGFRQIDCFWRWMNFAAWVAIA